MKTTRDEISIDIDGTIDDAITELRRLKKLYPDGDIRLENEYEHGESYPRLSLRFARPKTPAEIECERIRDKQRTLSAMELAAGAYRAEGDAYPRQSDLDSLTAELGPYAENGTEPIIRGDSVVPWNHMKEIMRSAEMMRYAMEAALRDSGSHPEGENAEGG